MAWPIPEAAPVTITFLPANPRTGPPRRPPAVDGLSAGGQDDRTLHRAVRLVLRDPRAPAVGARQRAHGLQERPRPGGGGRELRVGRLLDGRAPLPVGVLPLLEPRGPLRGRGGADRAHPYRVRGAAHAPALQPPRAHGRVGGRPRPHLRRAGATSERGARRPEPSSKASGSTRPRPAPCGRRPSATWWGAGPTTSTSWPASTGRCPSGASTPSPARDPHPPIWGATSSEDGHRQVGVARPGAVLVRRGRLPRRGEGQGGHLPRGRRRVHQAHRRLRQQPGGHVHHGAVRTGTVPPPTTRPASPSSGTRRPGPGRSRR